MKVKNNINNIVYEKFLDYAFKKCDSIMFVINYEGLSEKEKNKLNDTEKSIEKKYKKDINKKRNGTNWTYTIKDCDDNSSSMLYKIYFLNANERTKKYLLTNKNLFNWKNPEYPEDIAFFRNGKCWFYTITHEKIAEFNCNEQEYNQLKKIGIEFSEKLFKKNNNIYYEEY